MSFKKDCHKTEFTIFHVNRYILFTVKFQKKGFSFLYYAGKFTRTQEHICQTLDITLFIREQVNADNNENNNNTTA